MKRRSALFILLFAFVSQEAFASVITLSPGETLCETGSLSTPSGMVCDTVTDDFGQIPTDIVLATGDFEIGGFIRRGADSLYADTFGLVVQPGTDLTLELFDWRSPGPDYFDADFLMVSSTGEVIINTVISSLSPVLEIGPDLEGFYFVVLDAAGGDDVRHAVTNWHMTGSIAPVPEPTAAVLMLSGLGFLGFTARKKKNAVSA